MAGESAHAKAKRLRRSEEHRDTGREAEEATATALMALPPSWTVLDDLAWPGRRFENIDHVVIGPSGVFVIDSKSWSGRVESGVRLGSGRDRSPTVWGASAAARSVAGLVPSVRPDHVHAVVCVAEGAPRAAWADDVMVCSSDQLVGELIGHAVVLPGGLARAVAADVGRRLRPVDQPTSEQLTVQELTSKQRGRKRRPFGSLVLAVLAAAAGMALLSQPDALTSWVDVTGWVGDLAR
jgi:hypothetical protein